MLNPAAQADSVAAAKSVVDPGVPSFASRVRGSLLGGALGDAFGYLVEFDDLASIRRQYGPIGLFDLSQASGTAHFSDDTQMTLYTVDGLTEVLEWARQGVAADPTACLWLAYLRWLATQGEQPDAGAPSPLPRWIDSQEVLRHRRHPGNACLSGLRSAEMGSPSRPVNPNSKGCGTVMRSAPFGLLPMLEPVETVQWTTMAAALTHGHPAAWQSSAAFALLIRALSVETLPLSGALVTAIDYLHGQTIDAAVRERWDAALQAADAGRPDQGQSMDPEQLCNLLGEGWVAEEALAIAVYAVVVTRDAVDPVGHFLAAMRIAANHRGDSDSTASIAGNILGALYGEEALPWGWLQAAEAPDLIRTLADRFIELADVNPSQE
ncbi:ADP-ribosylglycohydrolase family protein [Psychromicrobium xiongbiense]|uniref:ADP-ribosylglycohydrolase family protein n=1 Tax=Psychromicrobium xiongbiense TaxID=3051184 RepID=UPI002556522F|nr:ADP-ribosylglycohydrolase family protein [Psychromicrobium sp. YIM S02556]